MFKKSLLKKIAEKEKVSLSFLEKGIEDGTIVVPFNHRRDNISKPIAIGKGLKIKINTNIGTSSEDADIKDELEKLKVSIQYGSHTVMDLSTGGNLSKIRKSIIANSCVPLGTVPIYELTKIFMDRGKSISSMNIKDFLLIIEDQAKDGVDFFTIHAGILKEHVEYLVKNRRLGGIVSRGGAILAHWMYKNKKENFIYTHFDEVLKILKKYNVVLSLGDSLRPGAIYDSTDRVQISELMVLGELLKRARKMGVQTMIEGPGHLRIDEIQANVQLQKSICKQAPFYVLGPVVTDLSIGYDHISAAIGSAIAALSGADFLCVVTPAEHLRHPSLEDIKEGVIASSIAAHAVDLLRFPDEYQRDYDISYYRTKRDWDKLFTLLLDKDKSKKYRESLRVSSEDICTMCGRFCSLKIVEQCNLLD